MDHFPWKIIWKLVKLLLSTTKDKRTTSRQKRQRHAFTKTHPWCGSNREQPHQTDTSRRTKSWCSTSGILTLRGPLEKWALKTSGLENQWSQCWHQGDLTCYGKQTPLLKGSHLDKNQKNKTKKKQQLTKNYQLKKCPDYMKKSHL